MSWWDMPSTAPQVKSERLWLTCLLRRRKMSWASVVMMPMWTPHEV